MPTKSTTAAGRSFYPEIFLISLAMILFEIAYTRVFSRHWWAISSSPWRPST
jgi:hypothetical protein